MATPESADALSVATPERSISEPPGAPLRDRLARTARRASPLVVVILFSVAIWLLHRELSHYRFEDIRQSFQALGRGQVGAAILLTILSYAVLTGYDALALDYIDRSLPYPRIALASFLGYVLSHNVGLSILGASAPRYRLYTTSDLSTGDVAKVITFTSLTFWLGWLTLGGAVLLLKPAVVAFAMSRVVAQRVGVAFLVVVTAYVLWTALRHRPLRAFGWSLEIPSTRTAAIQVLLSVLDWLTAAAVLYVLLPRGVHVTYVWFLGVFLFAVMAGLVSHVPGGLGVFETAMLMALKPAIPGHALLGSLLAFRVIYYLAPLAVALVLFSANEIGIGRDRTSVLSIVFDRWLPSVVPGFLAATTFVGGLVLLISGATPAAAGRLAFLQAMLPLSVLEASHFVGSLAGVGLLLLANGLQRRLDAAWVLSVALLAVGAVVSLLKGFDYEESLVLGLMLVTLLPARRRFYRRASLMTETFTPGWIVAILVALGGTTWLTMFAFKHVQYSRELWWQFAIEGEAPRALRALVGVLVIATGVAFSRVLRPSPRPPRAVDATAVARVGEIVARASRGYANLAWLGDKRFLLSDRGDAFLMYGVEGRSWVAMGDPVGPDEEQAELVWRFREECDRRGAWPVFYEVGARNLPLFLDAGLSPFKFGEEARVELSEFSLEGSHRKDMRYTLRRAERDGSVFEWLPRERVPEVLDEIEQVSQTWLGQRAAREKGFSLGAFRRDYIARFPLGVVRFEGRIVAFANLWVGADGEEIAPDLMRYAEPAPADTMEFLFLKLMLAAKEQGVRWFNLGMAPLAGMDDRALAPLWHRIGAFVYEYGRPFYNFEGLRRYKDQFDPLWEPKYLVVPSGLVLPRVLVNIASLVSGGVSGAISK